MHYTVFTVSNLRGFERSNAYGKQAVTFSHTSQAALDGKILTSQTSRNSTSLGRAAHAIATVRNPKF